MKAPYPTRRVPRNVPYVVDNIWAWTRPEELADRRSSAYASPTPKQARKFGRGDVYKVEVLGDQAVICQVIDPDVDDSKKHRDVAKSRVQKAILDVLGKHDWTELPVDAKTSAGRLCLPAVAPEEVGAILDDIGATEDDREARRHVLGRHEDLPGWRRRHGGRRNLLHLPGRLPDSCHLAHEGSFATPPLLPATNLARGPRGGGGGLACCQCRRLCRCW